MMKRLRRTFCCIMAGILLAACGSIAPPIDLPAPITGRITVSSPNEAGQVAVVGTEGAVPADSIVLAVNETKDVGFLHLLDRLVPNIFALEIDLPLICSRLHHACVISEADGSFYLEIDAEANDEISIVVIDGTGNPLSESTRVTISSLESISEALINKTACSNIGLTPDVKDLIVDASRTSFAITQGSETATNILTIKRFDDSGATVVKKEISLPGCFGKSVSVRKVDTPNSTYLMRVVVVSEQDFVLWTGLWDGESVLSPKTFLLPYQPLFVDILNANQLSIMVQAGKHVKASLLNIFAETFSETPLLLASDVRGLRHTTLEFQNGNHMTAILLDRLGTRGVVVFHPEELRILHEPSWVGDIGAGSATDIHLFFDPDGTSPFTALDLPQGIVETIIVDHDARRLYLFGLQSNLGLVTVLQNPSNLTSVDGSTYIPIDLPGTALPRFLTSARFNASVIGFLLMDDATVLPLCLGGACPQGAFGYDAFASGASDAVNIVASEDGAALFVADKEKGAIDLGDEVP